jgi:hypothetical protein
VQFAGGEGKKEERRLAGVNASLPFWHREKVPACLRCEEDNELQDHLRRMQVRG